MSFERVAASSSNLPQNKGGSLGSYRYSDTEEGCIVRTALINSFSFARAAFIAARNAVILNPT